MMSAAEALTWVLFVLVVCPAILYVAARLVFVAWFFSKQQYEKRKVNHG